MILYPRLITDTSFENSKIISYGLIVYALDTGQTIIVQRLHSIGFLLILTGQYRPSIICLLVKDMTLDEVIILESIIDNENLFEEIFIKVGYLQKDLDYAYMRFMESKHIIKNCLRKYNIPRLLEWTFPKGRLNVEYNEDPFICACREFTEEVEYELPEAVFVSDDYIVVENIKTLDCKIIETRCWLYVVKNEFELTPLSNHSEVKDRKWVSLHQALKLMDKKSLIGPIESIISQF